MKACPFCAEEIQDTAIKCKHCGSNLPRPDKPGYAWLVFGVIALCFGGFVIITASEFSGSNLGFKRQLEIGGVCAMLLGLALITVGGIVGRRRPK